MPALSVWMPKERARELQRVALELSLERNRRVTVSALVREALEAQWPSKDAGASQNESGKEDATKQ